MSAPEKRASEVKELLNHLTLETRSGIAQSVKDLRENGADDSSAYEYYIQKILENIPENILRDLAMKGNSLAYEFYVKQSHTTDSAVPKQAILGVTTDSAVSRPAILDMTETELDATLADAKRSELETDHQNRFKGVLGEGCKNPRKPQEQKENEGALAGFVVGFMHLLHNPRSANTSAATSEGAQYESQRSVLGESMYLHSTAPSKKDRKPTALWYDKSEAPKPTASQPKASRHNAKPSEPATQSPSRDFIGTALPGFHDQNDLPNSYSEGPTRVQFRNRGRNE